MVKMFKKHLNYKNFELSAYSVMQCLIKYYFLDESKGDKLSSGLLLEG